MTGRVLGADESARIREGIAAAVLGAPDELAKTLEHDAGEYLRLVDASRIGAEEAGRLLREAVLAARAAGHSWDAVGGILGVSRQAAQQRFAGKAGDGVHPAAPADGRDAPERRRIAPVSAFNEMAALAEGEHEGWHLVGYGAAYLEVEASAHPWEHRRVTLASSTRQRRMETEGWLPVGAGWFPWRYYKRALPATTRKHLA